MGRAYGTHRRLEKIAQSFDGKPEGKNLLEDQSVDGKMGSELILGRLAWRVWIGFDWLSILTSCGLL
jgi:hypothetical protein